MAELENLRKISNDLGNPGVQALWLAVRRNGINVTKKQVEAFVKQKGEKQIFSAVQPSKGKTVSESLDARWQMDLADLKGQPSEGYTFFLVAVNLFDRFMWALPLKSKEPPVVRDALAILLRSAYKKPKLISSDNGNEFLGAVSELLRKQKIAQSFKAVGDVNAIGVVDRAIQTLKGKLAELSAKTGRSWPSLLRQVVQQINDTPKPGVLHGNAPKEVRDDDDVQFMLLQDQARALQHNKQLTAKRQASLEDTGAFRAPLPESTSKFKRGFQATYGDVRTVANVRGSTVTDNEGKSYNIKQLKVVPATSTGATQAFAVNTAGPAKKRRLGAPIMDALASVLQGEEQISLTKASGLMRAQLSADGKSYNEILASTRASLIDLIRLADDRFTLVERPHGIQTWYFVALK
jgi:hypothetical protein